MKVTLIVLIALGASLALRNRSAAVRHWVLTMGIVGAGLAPLLGMVLPPWYQPMTNPPSAIASQNADSAVVTTDVQFSIPAEQASSQVAPGFRIERTLAALWLAGTGLGVF